MSLLTGEGSTSYLARKWQCWDSNPALNVSKWLCPCTLTVSYHRKLTLDFKDLFSVAMYHGNGPQVPTFPRTSYFSCTFSHN